MPADPVQIARHPLPTLQQQAGSGLDFPWVEYHPDPSLGSGSHTFGSDGVVVVMRMLVYWEDLPDALKQLLGYSFRDAATLTPRGTPWLRRMLPWRHPTWDHLYVKRISEVRGVKQLGKKTTSLGIMPSRGAPRTDFYLADLTIHFWRPPYYVRTDKSILGDDGNPREWTRYVSKNWEMSLNMLSRENSTFQWLPGIKPPGSNNYFTGSVGQALTHFRVSRTWYQIPEQALFSAIAGGTPDGLPTNMVYTQTPVENPLSKYDRALGSTLTTFSTTSGTATTVMTTTTIGTTRPNASQLLAATGYVYPASSPIGGCVNAPIGMNTNSTITTQYAVDTLGNWLDSTADRRFFGCYTGTLRFDGVTFTPQPLQLPPYLMKIPELDGIEYLSQQQYDVTFHFDLFDPPAGSDYGTPVRGHNLFPWSGNGQWYPILSQRNISGGTVGPYLTPFMYADFTDLFYIL